jgi:membrane protease YdiL (CAAX protease family)
MLAVVVGSILVGFVSGLPEVLASLVPSGGRYLFILLNGLLCIATVLMLLRQHGQPIASIGLGWSPPGGIVLAAIIAVPACYAAGAVINISIAMLSSEGLVSFAQERTEFLETVSDIPLAWVLPVSIFVGVYEEIVFRGLILSRLRTLFPSNAAPILISSAIFGVLHFSQGPAGMCQTAAVGLVLGVVVVRMGSIWPAILAHATIDTCSLVFTVLFLPEMQEAIEALSTSTPAS